MQECPVERRETVPMWEDLELPFFDAELTAPVRVRVHRLSKSAKEKITAAGGTFEEMWAESADEATEGSSTKEG